MYWEGLNEKQKEAVLYTEGPLLIIAGAGSGKTATMTRRIAYLVGDKNVNPYNILAVTFTNKAANEMKERVFALTDRTQGMWILTFHASCLRILRKHISKIGYKEDFTIYDALDQKTVIRECITDLGETEKEYPIPYIQSIISDCKNKGMTALEYKEQCENFRDDIVADVFLRYTATLKRNNALDFDDLLVKTVELFDANPEVLEEYAKRFQYIMVDEYQDTNNIQYKLIHMLASIHNNICVVGDEDQCIYEWRGASIRNILEFEQDFPGTKVIKLEQNYRSQGNILAAANSIIKNNVQRKGKTLWTDKESGKKIQICQAYSDKEEAFYITREIHKLLDKGSKCSDIAVLYRTHAQSRSFEDAFSKQDLPYRVIGGTKFYDRKEIRDIIAYMKLINNNQDNLAFKRTINEPKRSIGEKSIEKLEILAQVEGRSAFEELSIGTGMEILSVKAAENAKSYIDAINKYTVQKNKSKISEIYDGLLADSGYKEYLEAQNTVESKGRIENLLEFKSVIYDFEEQNPEGTFEEFLEKIALITDIDNHDGSEDAVSLMTLHSAKGLEFPIVFMPGMEKGTFPSRNKGDSKEKMEEERRLCYVGMTRAKELLYMTWAMYRVVYGSGEDREASTFLQEIDPAYVEYHETEGKSAALNKEKQKMDRFDPKEQMKYLRQQKSAILGHAATKIETTKSSLGSEFKGGERVRHSKFGEGLVVGIMKGKDNTTLTIIFDSVGQKNFDADIVKLQKI